MGNSSEEIVMEAKKKTGKKSFFNFNGGLEAFIFIFATVMLNILK